MLINGTHATHADELADDRHGQRPTGNRDRHGHGVERSELRQLRSALWAEPISSRSCWRN